MNDIDMLDDWGWINKTDFLWWNFKYPKEERRYFENLGDFLNEFQKVGEVDGREIKVATSDYIPVSKLALDIDGRKIEFMLTARPFTSREIKQYFSDWCGFKPYSQKFYVDYYSKEFDPKDDKQNDKRCIEHLKESISKEGCFNFADHFLPHIRGIVKEVDEDSIFYYTMYSKFYGKKPNRTELIRENLERAKLNILPNITSIYGFHDVHDAIIKSLNYCKESNLFYRVNNSMNYRVREPIKINKSFTKSIYNLMDSNKNQFAYYPLLIDGHKEAIPFFLCNNFYSEKGLFNLGVYSEEYFYPIIDKELLKKSSEELNKRLNQKVQPIYFTKFKGNLRPEKI